MTDTTEPGGRSRRPPAKKAAATPPGAGVRNTAEPPDKAATKRAAAPRKAATKRAAAPRKAVTKKAVAKKAVAKKAVAKKAVAKKAVAKKAVAPVEPEAPVTQADDLAVSDQPTPTPPPPPPPAANGPSEPPTAPTSAGLPPPPPPPPPPPGGDQGPPPPPPGWSPPGAAPQWGPPAGARTEGMAIAAFVVGLVSILFSFLIIPPVVAIVLGALALRRIKKNPGRRGRGLAVAGLVLGIVMTLVGAAVDVGIVLFIRDTSTYEELKPGDCVKDPGDEFILIRTQNCNGRHEQEVFATLDNQAPSSAPYPGNAALLDFAQAECSARFPETGTVPPRSELQQIVLFPSRSRWNDGERRIVCLVGRADDTPLTAPLQGIG